MLERTLAGLPDGPTDGRVSVRWGTQRPKAILPIAFATCPSSVSGNGLPREMVPRRLFPTPWASGAALSS